MIGTVLISYGFILILRPHVERMFWRDSEISVWALQDNRQLLSWMIGAAWSEFFELLWFIMLGFVAARFFSHDSVAILRGRSWWRTLVMALLISASLAVMSVVLKAVAQDQRIVSLSLAAPVLGCVLGVWFGSIWRRGARGQLRMLMHILVFAVFLGLLGVAAVVLAIEDAPLSFEPAAVTSEDKRQLVKLFREKDPRDVESGEIQTLSLTTAEVNRVLSWGLSVGSRDRKAVARLSHDWCELRGSIALPFGSGRRCYLNITASGRIDVTDGHVRFRHGRMRVGRLSVPRWLVGLLSSGVLAQVEQDRHAKLLMEALRHIELRNDRMTVEYGRVELPPGFVSDVFDRLRPTHDSLPTIRLYVRHLLASSERFADEESRFALCVEEAFQLARRRSQKEDPVLENRAAIYALAILLGHRRVESLVGRVVDAEIPSEALHLFRAVPLRGRADWTKHFWVSAALALLSNQFTSDATGLLKEELDAGGGSGFSFSDLLADRAGTTFALTATRTEDAARAMQDRLADGFIVDDFFPPARDLPEGISDAELTRQFGGVDGPEYARVVHEIERRIANCSAYH
jgi:hypothetical protein